MSELDKTIEELEAEVQQNLKKHPKTIPPPPPPGV